MPERIARHLPGWTARRMRRPFAGKQKYLHDEPDATDGQSSALRAGRSWAELQFPGVDGPAEQRRVLEIVLPQSPRGPVALLRQGAAGPLEIAGRHVDERRCV